MSKPSVLLIFRGAKKICNALPGTYFLSVVQAHGIKHGNIWGSNYLGEGGSIAMIMQQPPLVGI